MVSVPEKGHILVLHRKMYLVLKGTCYIAKLLVPISLRWRIACI